MKTKLLFTILCIFNLSCTEIKDNHIAKGAILYSNSDYKEEEVVVDKNQAIIFTGYNSPYISYNEEALTPIEIKLKNSENTYWIDSKNITNSFFKNKYDFISKTLLPNYYEEAILRDSVDIIINKDYLDPEWDASRKQILTFMHSHFRPWRVIINNSTISLVGPDDSKLFYIIKSTKDDDSIILDIISADDSQLIITISILELTNSIKLNLLQTSVPLEKLYFRVDLFEEEFIYSNKDIVHEIIDFIP